MNLELGYIAGILLILLALIGLAFWFFVGWCYWREEKRVKHNWPEVKKP